MCFLKRVLVLSFAVILSFSITACNEKNDNGDSESTLTINDAISSEDKNKEQENSKDNSNEIDLFSSEYIEVKFSGYNGIGDMIVNILHTNDYRINYYWDYVSSTLKNGDEVLIEAEYINEDSEIVTASKKYIVSGLEELIEIDPFENLEIQFDGISPFVSVSYNTSKCSDIINQFTFTSDKELYRFDDTMYLTANYDEEDLASQGYLVTNNTKEYKVQDVPVYITSFDDISKDELEQAMYDYIEAQTNACVGTHGVLGYGFVNEWGIAWDVSEIKSIKIKERKLFTIKDSKRTDIPQNKYMNKYVVSFVESGETYEIYAGVFIENIVKNPDGTLLFNKELELNSAQFYWKSDKSTNSYDSKFVIAEKADYNVNDIK